MKKLCCLLVAPIAGFPMGADFTGSLDAMLVEEFGADKAKLKDLKRQQLAEARAEGALAGHGEIGRGRNRGSKITSKDRGTSATYLARRLLRDAPEVFARLESFTRWRTRGAAAATTPEQVPMKQGERTDLGKLPKCSQGTRAAATAVSVRTQRKLDRLARERPDLLKRVQEGFLSVHRAAVEAGLVKVPTKFVVNSPRHKTATKGTIRFRAHASHVQNFSAHRTWTLGFSRGNVSP